MKEEVDVNRPSASTGTVMKKDKIGNFLFNFFFYYYAGFSVDNWHKVD